MPHPPARGTMFLMATRETKSNGKQASLIIWMKSKTQFGSKQTNNMGVKLLGLGLYITFYAYYFFFKFFNNFNHILSSHNLVKMLKELNNSTNSLN